MDEKTRAHFIAQMKKTQIEFDKLKAVVMDEPHEDVAVTFEEIENQPVVKPRIANDDGWPVTCSACGIKTFVPFKPNEKYPVYCRECYDKKRMNGK